tara:strand:- start:1537 stop:1869 length:333 start_codon:yes stop_codon:yes gene_type:complete
MHSIKSFESGATSPLGCLYYTSARIRHNEKFSQNTKNTEVLKVTDLVQVEPPFKEPIHATPANQEANHVVGATLGDVTVYDLAHVGTVDHHLTSVQTTHHPTPSVMEPMS